MFAPSCRHQVLFLGLAVVAIAGVLLLVSEALLDRMPTPEGLVDSATDVGAAGDRSDAADPDPDELPPRDETIDLAADVDDATDTVSPLPLIAALLVGLAVLLAAGARLIPLLRRRRSKDDPHG